MTNGVAANRYEPIDDPVTGETIYRKRSDAEIERLDAEARIEAIVIAALRHALRKPKNREKGVEFGNFLARAHAVADEYDEMVDECCAGNMERAYDKACDVIAALGTLLEHQSFEGVRDA